MPYPRKIFTDEDRRAARRRYKEKQKAKPDFFNKAKQWAMANTERRRALTRKSYLKIKFGLTEDQYNEMFQNQGGKCAICGTHQQDLKRKLAIDHNHDTGQIRGLLCFNCNTALGGFSDSAEILSKALDYLGKY